MNFTVNSRLHFERNFIFSGKIIGSEGHNLAKRVNVASNNLEKVLNTKMEVPNSIFELLSSKSFRSRPGMFIGEKKISILRAFIDGYLYAAESNSTASSENEKFAEFHDWVANYFGWYESTAGWKNIILKECNGNEEIAVDKFFEVYDKFTESQDLTVTTGNRRQARFRIL